MVYANDFKGRTDSERLNAAIKGRDSDRIVVIEPREGDRDFWLLDGAITLPENTTVVLRNVKIKLSDACRDNFFRSATASFALLLRISALARV